MEDSDSTFDAGETGGQAGGEDRGDTAGNTQSCPLGFESLPPKFRPKNHNEDSDDSDDDDSPHLRSLARKVDEEVSRIILEAQTKNIKEVTPKNIQRLNQLANLYGASFNDEESLNRFRDFYHSASLRLDPLVNECAVLRMIMAEEAAKPSRAKMAEIQRKRRDSAGIKDEESYVKSSFLEEAVYVVLNSAQKSLDLDEDTVESLLTALVNGLSRKIVRYGDERVERFMEEDNPALWRDDTLITKLASAITNIEKARQTIQDSLHKAQVEVRFNLLVHQVLNILDKKCKDKLLLRDVALAIQELAKEEEIEVDWVTGGQQSQ